MPLGTLVMVPVPVPVRLTPTWSNAEKLAVIVVSDVGVNVHGPLPTQRAELHPTNTEFAAGVAVSVTAAPCATDAEHVAPQLIPEGLLTTVPAPSPAVATISVVCGGGAATKLAMTD